VSDSERFAIFMAAAVVVFVGVLRFVLRRRASKPRARELILITLVVVVFGMLFARYSHIFFNPPWWIYYGVPAVLTFVMPPIALRMNRREILQYVPLSILMAPAIHVFFSLFVGWHDYMPFPWYVRSLRELVG
jgi:hypothetical protein